MSLTFKLEMVFSVLFLFQTCVMAFAAVSIQKHPFRYTYQQGAQPYFVKAVFHVSLLHFEHLPLQRSLHGPAADVRGSSWNHLDKKGSSM